MSNNVRVPSSEEINTLWNELGEPLYPVHLTVQDTGHPDDATRAFLAEIGFPESAEPGLDFTDLSDKLFTHTQLYTRDDFPALDEYLVIGATGEGNPICIDASSGNVIYVDHDNGFEAIFINSSLIQFNYCIACYNLATQDQAALAPGKIKSLEEALYAADPPALEENTFWTNELIILERKISL